MTPLVLIPGMMCDGRMWRSQITGFGSDRAIHLAPITGRDNVQDLARDILAQAPPIFALAGLSMGGIVAMEIVRQAPTRVERLALLDTNPCAETEAIKAAREPQIAKVRAGGLIEVMRDELKPNYLADSPKKPMILELCMSMATQLGPEVFERQSRALQSRPDQQETLRAYGGPSLVLMGKEDRLCPIDRHELMARLLPNATLAVIDGAGHLPVLEKPFETNNAMRTWLER